MCDYSTSQTHTHTPNPRLLFAVSLSPYLSLHSTTTFYLPFLPPSFPLFPLLCCFCISRGVTHLLVCCPTDIHLEDEGKYSGGKEGKPTKNGKKKNLNLGNGAILIAAAAQPLTPSPPNKKASRTSKQQQQQLNLTLTKKSPSSFSLPLRKRERLEKSPKKRTLYAKIVNL